MTDRSYAHILVPTDFAPDRRAAYRLALATASGTDATVTLLHVAPMPSFVAEDEYHGLDAFRLMHRAPEPRSGWLLSREAIAAQNAALEGRLRAEVSVQEAGSARLRCAVRRGDLEVEIARFVRESDVDLLVVADTPPGLLPRFGRRLADRLAREVSAEVVRVLPNGTTGHPKAVA